MTAVFPISGPLYLRNRLEKSKRHVVLILDAHR